MVLNLLPPLTVSKGSAVNWLVRQHQLEGLVYFGDDVTDAHAFRALRMLRDNNQAETLSIGVVGRETPASVRQLADLSVGGAREFDGLTQERHRHLGCSHHQSIGRIDRPSQRLAV